MVHASFSVIDTLLGPMWLCATDTAVCGVGFGSTISTVARHHFDRYGIDLVEEGTGPLLTQAADQLKAYFRRTLKAFDVPLDLRGTPFQRAVWNRLLQIPYGETVTYGEIAHDLDKPRASQAIGQAVGRNPVVIIVPCHRVLGKGGHLTGYGGGLARKRTLLQLEQAGVQLRISLT